MRQVLESSDKNVGYNAATGTYEDLLKAGIIDPVKARTANPRPRSNGVPHMLHRCPMLFYASTSRLHMYLIIYLNLFSPPLKLQPSRCLQPKLSFPTLCHPVHTLHHSA